MKKSSGNFERFLVIGVALGVVVISVALNLFVHTYRMPTASMAPTLPMGCRVIAFTTNDAARGDIIAFRDPRQPQTPFTMRVAAVAGDEVQIVDRKLLVNGKPVAEPPRDDFAPFRLPPGHYFVLGDNRGASSESRTVRREDLVARVAYVFTWPGGLRKV